MMRLVLMGTLLSCCLKCSVSSSLLKIPEQTNCCVWPRQHYVSYSHTSVFVSVRNRAIVHYRLYMRSDAVTVILIRKVIGLVVQDGVNCLRSVPGCLCGDVSWVDSQGFQNLMANYVADFFI